VLGLGEDLLPRDERFWARIGHTRLVAFDDAARAALAQESDDDAAHATVAGATRGGRG
jgi:hypothetical protein